MLLLSRRLVVQAVGFAALLPASRLSAAPGLQMTVHKNPGCECCDGWVEHLRANGFAATVIETSEINRIKTRLGIPADLASCHTAEADAYVLEGHVPATAVKRLLEERPQAQGLAVPGMPSGSPGMNGDPEEYDVILFGAGARRVYGRFKSDREV